MPDTLPGGVTNGHYRFTEPVIAGICRGGQKFPFRKKQGYFI